MSKNVLIISSNPVGAAIRIHFVISLCKVQKKRAIGWIKSGSRSLPSTIALPATPVKSWDIV